LTDEEEVVETVIASSEMNKDEIVETLEVIDDFEDLDIPFAVIEDVPIFPGCEKVR
jgi:protein TonB